MYWNYEQMERNNRLFETIEWMSDSPWYSVKQYLLNRGYTITEINRAAQTLGKKQ